jgi:HK97 family phage prohead protease
VNTDTYLAALHTLDPGRMSTTIAMCPEIRTTVPSAGNAVREVNDMMNPKHLLFRSHDHANPIGNAAQMWKTEHGLCARFRNRNGKANAEVLDELDQALWPAFNVGFFHPEHVRRDDGVRDLVRAQVVEISLVAIPAYTDATVYEVGGRPVDRAVPTFNVPAPTPMPDLSFITKPPPSVDLTAIPLPRRW